MYVCHGVTRIVGTTLVRCSRTSVKEIFLTIYRTTISGNRVSHGIESEVS